MNNLTKLWKTRTGPPMCDRAWSRSPKSALFEILKNKENYQQFSKIEIKEYGVNIT